MAFFITGCMRSGTTTYSKILGIRHEKQFTYKTDKVPKEPLQSEVSWLIAPFSKQLLENGHKLIRLVRHPLKVINSFVGMGTWTKQMGYGRFTNFIRQYIVLPDEGCPAQMTLDYWVQWNQLIPEIVPTIRIEDLIGGLQENQGRRASIDINSVDWQHAIPLMRQWNYSL
jgi:hypothetical protein